MKAEMAFGFRRLSILDISNAGHQPMSYLNRYWIVFNGEIYNYIEIKNELQSAGYSFTTRTDTEVILAAYHKWGNKCLDRFNGMWAFIIYDIQLKKVFISRDRFAIKPMFYYLDEDILIAASEIKSILKCKSVKTVPNSRYIKNYLKTGGQEQIKKTAFENIYRFKYASYIELSINEIKATGIKEIKFWNLKSNLNNEKYDENKAVHYAQQYKELLEDACNLRLRADVKVGSALSGGLDSSSIVLSINHLLKKKNIHQMQETFSCVYNREQTKEYDESPFIEILTKFLNVSSHRIEPDVDVIKNDYRKLVYIMDNPPNDSAMSGWFVYKLVKNTGVIVMLDGQGADEQQGGYLTYVMNYLINLPLRHWFSEYNSFKSLSQLNKNALLMSFILNITGKCIPGKIVSAVFKIMGKNPDMLLPVNKFLEKDMNDLLVKLLHYGDRLSMAHSVESRAPFMDYRLVEFTASIPAIYKLHSGWTKYFARLAMQENLPTDIVWRKDKVGFPNAPEYWFREVLKDWCISSIENSGLLKQMKLGRNIRENYSKISITYFNRLLNLSLWDNVFWSNAN
jgi:asparagine synthase (glutamine-hydrolysing)